MTPLVKAHATSSADPAAFFARWADMTTWPEWNLDTEWVRLDGPFVTGSTGVLKPKGGPKVPFVIERLDQGREFVDVSRLVGARLMFDHQVTSCPAGGCEVAVTVTLTGPLRAFWRLVLGGGIVKTAQADLDRLVSTTEQDVATAPAPEAAGAVDGAER